MITLEQIKENLGKIIYDENGHQYTLMNYSIMKDGTVLITIRDLGVDDIVHPEGYFTHEDFLNNTAQSIVKHGFNLELVSVDIGQPRYLKIDEVKANLGIDVAEYHTMIVNIQEPTRIEYSYDFDNWFRLAEVNKCDNLPIAIIGFVFVRFDKTVKNLRCEEYKITVKQ